VANGHIEVGGECYDSRECTPGLLCTLEGRCSEGAIDAPCHDDDDCIGMTVCVGGACAAAP
jgi:hypothetical protein